MGLWGTFQIQRTVAMKGTSPKVPRVVISGIGDVQHREVHRGGRFVIVLGRDGGGGWGVNADGTGFFGDGGNALELVETLQIHIPGHIGWLLSCTPKKCV